MEVNSCIRQKADVLQIIRCKERVSELNDSFDFLSSGIELAGNNVRLRILFLLFEEDELCVCDLSDILGLSVSAVSQHLRKLSDRGVVIKKRNAQTIYYSLSDTYSEVLKPLLLIIVNNNKPQEYEVK